MSKIAELKTTPDILTLAPGEIAIRFVNMAQPLLTTGSCTVGVGNAFVDGSGQGGGQVAQLVLQLNGLVRCIYGHEAPGGKVWRRTWFSHWAHAVE